MVFQMQLAKAVDAVPLTRDYMLDWERTASAADRSSRAGLSRPDTFRRRLSAMQPHLSGDPSPSSTAGGWNSPTPSSSGR